MGKGYRQGRIGEEIRKIISEMLMRELKDPRLTGSMISITGVDVTKDNSFAYVYFTVLGQSSDEEENHRVEEEVLEGLSSAEGRLRKEIGKNIKMRRVPELIFRVDRSMEYGNHIEEVIRTLGIDKYDE